MSKHQIISISKIEWLWNWSWSCSKTWNIIKIIIEMIKIVKSICTNNHYRETIHYKNTVKTILIFLHIFLIYSQFYFTYLYCEIFKGSVSIFISSNTAHCCERAVYTHLNKIIESLTRLSLNTKKKNKIKIINQ